MRTFRKEKEYYNRISKMKMCVYYNQDVYVIVMSGYWVMRIVSLFEFEEVVKYHIIALGLQEIELNNRNIVFNYRGREKKEVHKSINKEIALRNVVTNQLNLF